MTTTNDKLRSLFLAALMVFSVFAMTVALPGSAAANDTNYTQGEDYDDTLSPAIRRIGKDRRSSSRTTLTIRVPTSPCV